MFVYFVTAEIFIHAFFCIFFFVEIFFVVFLFVFVFLESGGGGLKATHRVESGLTTGGGPENGGCYREGMQRAWRALPNGYRRHESKTN